MSARKNSCVWEGIKPPSRVWRTHSIILLLLAFHALQTSGVDDERAFQAIQADVSAFRLHVDQQTTLDFPSVRNPTDRQYGIVIPAGGRLQMMQAYMVALIIRKAHHCSLPIFVYHWGMGEDDPKVHSALQDLEDIDIVDGKHLPYPNHHRAIRIPANEAAWDMRDGWTVKVLSLYHAPFKEVLYLDSDSMPLVDPTHLFSGTEYRRSGAYFWPDYWYGRAAKISETISVPEPQVQIQTESGQFLIHRHLHADVFEWLWFLATHHGVLFQLMHGDKDLYLPAFQLAGKESTFHHSSFPPRMALAEKEKEGYIYIGIIQSSARGHPLFLHRAGGDKLRWERGSLPHFMTHISAPMTDEQAHTLFSEVFGHPGYIFANSTELVPVASSEQWSTSIPVAPLESLDHQSRVMLDKVSRKAYSLVEEWDQGTGEPGKGDWF